MPTARRAQTIHPEMEKANKYHLKKQTCAMGGPSARVSAAGYARAISAHRAEMLPRIVNGNCPRAPKAGGESSSSLSPDHHNPQLVSERAGQEAFLEGNCNAQGSRTRGRRGVRSLTCQMTIRLFVRTAFTQAPKTATILVRDRITSSGVYSKRNTENNQHTEVRGRSAAHAQLKPMGAIIR